MFKEHTQLVLFCYKDTFHCGNSAKRLTVMWAAVGLAQAAYSPQTVPVKHLPAISMARNRVLTCPRTVSAPVSSRKEKTYFS